MNGNFEFDRGAYPYGGVTVGNGVLLHNIQTLAPVCKLTLPRSVVRHAALELNKLHYSGLPQDLVDALNDPKEILAAAVRTAYTQAEIDGAVTQSLLDQIKAL